MTSSSMCGSEALCLATAVEAAARAATMARTASAAGCFLTNQTVQPARRRATDMGVDRGAKAVRGLGPDAVAIRDPRVLK
jgi:hypothetical protein